MMTLFSTGRIQDTALALLTARMKQNSYFHRPLRSRRKERKGFFSQRSPRLCGDINLAKIGIINNFVIHIY